MPDQSPAANPLAERRDPGTPWSTAEWVAHLRSLVGTALPEVAGPVRRLGAGPIDEPLLAALRGESPALPPAFAQLPKDAQLWWLLHAAVPDPASVLGVEESGPLLRQDAFLAIEVWTESELAALHALGKLVRLGAGAAWKRRLAEARDWHLEHTQPDNATQRPWALAVFASAGSPEATLYAQTLLHNALAASTPLERLSHAILLDAAAELERV